MTQMRTERRSYCKTSKIFILKSNSWEIFNSLTRPPANNFGPTKLEDLLLRSRDVFHAWPLGEKADIRYSKHDDRELASKRTPPNVTRRAG